jgi:hypothetical protein
MSTFQVQSPIVHKPSIKLFEISAQQIRSIIESQPIVWRKIKLTDNNYFYVSWEDWDKVFQYLMKELPAYVPEKFDCENFAGYLRVMAAKEFGINTCGDGEGFVDFQDDRGWLRHGWTVFTEGTGLYQVESQMANGYSIMDIDSDYYKPDEIVIG